MSINYSFIIPHHNNRELLKRCVDSIPNRDDVQIIIVDDNSDSDEIPQTQDFSKCVHIEYIDKSQSKGAGKARNVGLSLAIGKWVLFSDCDDFYEEGFLDFLDDYRESSFDVIYFDIYWALNLKTGKCLRDYYKTYIQNYIENPQNHFNRIMLKHSNNCLMNKMISNDYIKRISAKFEEVPACNDGYFAQKIGFETNNFFVINKKLYYYIQNENSITTKKISLRKRIEKIKVVGRLHKYMEKNGAMAAVPPFFRGFGLLMKKNGMFYAVVAYLAKMFYDVSPMKYMMNCIKRGKFNGD